MPVVTHHFFPLHVDLFCVVCVAITVIISSSVKSVSVGLELNCRNSGYKDAIVTVTLTVAQTDTGEAIQDVTLSCNSTKEVNFLKSSTNYTINTLIGSASSGLICSLKYFVTDQDQASKLVLYDTYSYYVTVAINR